MHCPECGFTFGHLDICKTGFIVNSLNEVSKNNCFKQALEVVTGELKRDEGLMESYIANIAMAFCDEYHRVKNKKTSTVSLKKIHIIANNAAKNFLEMWCK